MSGWYEQIQDFQLKTQFKMFIDVCLGYSPWLLGSSLKYDYFALGYVCRENRGESNNAIFWEPWLY